jgi:SAM-dependent methyltransferase
MYRSGMSWTKFEYLRRVLWEIDLPMVSEEMLIHLDLGAGNRPRNPFNANKLLACDVFPISKFTAECDYIQCDITVELPFPSNTFSSVSAYDVLEHVPRWERRQNQVIFPFVNLMSEIYRVLKPGGYFYAVTPMFPRSSAFTDPTHVNYITLESVNYFGGPSHSKHLGYGFEGSFKIIFANWLRGAGPFDPTSSLANQVRNNPWSKISILALLRLLRRFLLTVLNLKPTHGLWVLQKPK